LTETKRLRVFAGPNGSGKSTIIRAVSQFKTTQGFLLPLGYYINADDIATLLNSNGFSFTERGLPDFNIESFIGFAQLSGLISESFTTQHLKSSFNINNNFFKLTPEGNAERVAQLLARYIRQEMIEKGLSHSYETVFSHPSTITDMQKARDAGFKVYLYFVATESPEINKARVLQRVAVGGHNVPTAKIEERYYKSLDLMHDAAQLCDEVWFFDNSKNTYSLVAHFKVIEGKKSWGPIVKEHLANWFIKYYLYKVNR
jgi:predicted ABC-type ATPase